MLASFVSYTEGYEIFINVNHISAVTQHKSNLELVYIFTNSNDTDSTFSIKGNALMISNRINAILNEFSRK